MNTIVSIWSKKYARIFVLGNYVPGSSQESFPRAMFSENCSLLGTDNVREQISEHIFAPNGGYQAPDEEQIMSKDKYLSIFSPQMATIVFIILQIFFATRAVLKIGECSRMFPSFSWGIFGHVTRLGQSRVSKNI